MSHLQRYFVIGASIAAVRMIVKVEGHGGFDMYHVRTAGAEGYTNIPIAVPAMLDGLGLVTSHVNVLATRTNDFKYQTGIAFIFWHVKTPGLEYRFGYYSSLFGE